MIMQENGNCCLIALDAKDVDYDIWSTRQVFHFFMYFGNNHMQDCLDRVKEILKTLYKTREKLHVTAIATSAYMYPPSFYNL